MKIQKRVSLTLLVISLIYVILVPFAYSQISISHIPNKEFIILYDEGTISGSSGSGQASGASFNEYEPHIYKLIKEQENRFTSATPKKEYFSLGKQFSATEDTTQTETVEEETTKEPQEEQEKAPSEEEQEEKEQESETQPQPQEDQQDEDIPKQQEPTTAPAPESQKEEPREEVVQAETPTTEEPVIFEQTAAPIDIFTNKIHFVEAIKSLDLEVVSVPENDADELISRIYQLDGVAFVEENVLLQETTTIEENDPHLLDSSNSLYYWPYDYLGVKDAYNIFSEIPSTKTKVGVIDSGTLTSHEEFQGQVWNSANCKGADGTTVGATQCKNGGQWFSRSRVYDSGLPTVSSHGTAVASQIVARGGNSAGLRGVLDNAALVNINVSNATSTVNSATYSIADMARGVAFAQQNGVKVINMSLGIVYTPSDNIHCTVDNSGGSSGGGDGTPDFQQSALYRAFSNYTGLAVISAGNDGATISQSNHFSIPNDYGARIERGSSICWTPLENIVSVGSIASNSGISSFSNRGLVLI